MAASTSSATAPATAAIGVMNPRRRDRARPRAPMRRATGPTSAASEPEARTQAREVARRGSASSPAKRARGGVVSRATSAGRAESLRRGSPDRWGRPANAGARRPGWRIARGTSSKAPRATAPSTNTSVTRPARCAQIKPRRAACIGVHMSPRARRNPSSRSVNSMGATSAGRRHVCRTRRRGSNVTSTMKVMPPPGQT